MYFASGVVCYCNSALIGENNSYLVYVARSYTQKIDSQSSHGVTKNFFKNSSQVLLQKPTTSCHQHHVILRRDPVFIEPIGNPACVLNKAPILITSTLHSVP